MTDLTTDGASLSVYFWVDTDKNSPLQVFDEVASGIKKALSKAAIELYPPTTVLVKNPNTENADLNEEDEKSNDDI